MIGAVGAHGFRLNLLSGRWGQHFLPVAPHSGVACFIWNISCASSRGRQQMKPEVKYSVARCWKAPFSNRWKHYLSRVAQFVAFVDFFFTGGSEEKVKGWLGEV